MQLRVTAKRLNMRRFIPWQIPEPTGIVGQVDEGYVFEGIEVGLAEIPNPAIGKWYKDRDGFYYWGGGVMEVVAFILFESPVIPNSYFTNFESRINWNEAIRQIPAEWKATKGAGVKIAILDTGVFIEHEDLKNAVVTYKDFTAVDDKIDYEGHGTHITGLIGARSSFINGIIGAAPLAEISMLKVLPDGQDGGDLQNFQGIIDALDSALAQGVDIINLSLSLKISDSPAENEILKVNDLRKKIKEITDAKIIITAAAGDNANLRSKKLFFPSDCEGVISIAAINKGYFDRNPDFSEKLNIAGPRVNYVSTYRPPLFYERFGGCSMTTAFITGVIALAISFNRSESATKFSKSEILAMLKEHSVPLNEINYDDDKSFYYHILNPIS